MILSGRIKSCYDLKINLTKTENQNEKSKYGDDKMAKGGYRIGAGRPKGSKSKNKKKADINIETAAALEDMTPLDYMLKIMRDPNQDDNRRDKMAGLAAPFVHARKGEGAGKKETQAERALKAGKGRFGAGRAPLSLIK